METEEVSTNTDETVVLTEELVTKVATTSLVELLLVAEVLVGFE